MTSFRLKKLPYLLSKRGQEEIMGFIIILVLVVVIGMFFIFLMKPKAQEPQNTQVENLLSAIKHTSSDCGKEMSDVAVMCNRDENCGNENACTYLRGKLKEIIDLAIDKAGMGNVIGYSMNVTGLEIDFKEGNSTANSMGAISPINKDISMQLRFFYP